jgi:hypothetical protein
MLANPRTSLLGLRGAACIARGSTTAWSGSSDAAALRARSWGAVMSPRRPGPATDHEAAASSGVAVTVAAGVLLTATGTAAAVCYARWALADDVSRRRSRAEGSTPRASKSTRRTTATDRPKRTEEQAVRPCPNASSLPRRARDPALRGQAGHRRSCGAGRRQLGGLPGVPTGRRLPTRRMVGAGPRRPVRAPTRGSSSSPACASTCSPTCSPATRSTRSTTGSRASKARAGRNGRRCGSTAG